MKVLITNRKESKNIICNLVVQFESYEYSETSRKPRQNHSAGRQYSILFQRHIIFYSCSYSAQDHYPGRGSHASFTLAMSLATDGFSAMQTIMQ